MQPSGLLVVRGFVQMTVQVQAPQLTSEFKAAFGGHPAGVSIITADSPTGPVGITASSVASVSAEPPLLAFSLAANRGSAAAIAVADTVVVHLLTTADLELARTFADSGAERFTGSMVWIRLDGGEPLLLHAGHALRCKILSRTPAGGSLLLAAEVVEIFAPESPESPESPDSLQAAGLAGPLEAPGVAGGPLVYHRRCFHALGEHSILPR